MRILSIESSCDETSASIIEKTSTSVKVHALKTATSLALHATTGGIIPENAARQQVKYMLPVIVDALIETTNKNGERNEKADWEIAKSTLYHTIDAIAVTSGPGLIGSLLVGVETAKTLAFLFNKPLIPINHLIAHIYANFINRNETDIKFPFIGLIVSGGHTDLLIFKSHEEYEWLGGTRDDASGEAFDKAGRLLNLAYPAGPEIERRASLVTNPTLNFTSPLINSPDFDFSFSGLKTQVLRLTQKEATIDTNLKNNICHALQSAIVKVLVKKTLNASLKHNAKMILVGGGVSSNDYLKSQLSSQSNIPVLFPEKIYSTDNAAMIGALALHIPKSVVWQKIKANPELYFS